MWHRPYSQMDEREEGFICTSHLICIISIINLFVSWPNDFWGAEEHRGVFDPNHKAQAMWVPIEDMATNSKPYLLGSYLYDLWALTYQILFFLCHIQNNTFP